MRFGIPQVLALRIVCGCIGSIGNLKVSDAVRWHRLVHLGASLVAPGHHRPLLRAPLIFSFDSISPLHHRTFLPCLHTSPPPPFDALFSLEREVMPPPPPPTNRKPTHYR